MPSDRGYIDLHVHYLPGVDDGVRTLADGLALCQGLAGIGYARAVATPHIRTAMFDNTHIGLAAVFERFQAAAAELSGLPELGLAAEHFCDDVFWGLFADQRTLPFPGGHAVLIEFPDSLIPLGIGERFFKMRVAGVSPVLAHPERYRPLFRKTDPIDALLDAGLILQLDVMALTGRYGRRPRIAAERMLDEQAYYIACSDAHRPDDVPVVAEALDRLHELVDPEYATQLLRDNPARILTGDIDL